MKKIIVPLANGFEEIEAISIIDVLRRADIDVTTAYVTDKSIVEGAHGVSVIADKSIDELGSLKEYDGIVVPGGMDGVNNLIESKSVLEIIAQFAKSGKLAAAICAGPMVLEAANILEGVSATCYPGLENELKSADNSEEIVVVDRNIITSRGPATAMYFALAVVEYLSGIEVRNTVSEGLLFNLCCKG